MKPFRVYILKPPFHSTILLTQIKMASTQAPPPPYDYDYEEAAESTPAPTPPKRFPGPDLRDSPALQKYGGRRLKQAEVDELQAQCMYTKDEYIMRDILRAAGWIWDSHMADFYYNVECDYYLGEPKRDQYGCITPEAMMEWYDDAVTRGVLPEELNEETANLIYGTWTVDHSTYKNGSNKRFEEFWDMVDYLVYGDRYMSMEEAIAMNEEMKMRECYDPSGEI